VPDQPNAELSQGQISILGILLVGSVPFLIILAFAVFGFVSINR
jgi:hypothetical protein